jgi:hypothetical protein
MESMIADFPAAPDFSKLPFPSLLKEWVEYAKNPNYEHPDPMVRASRASDTSLMDFMDKDIQAKVGGNIDSAFALLCGSAIWRKPGNCTSLSRHFRHPPLVGC